MAEPLVLILRAPGTNCDAETAHAFHLAAARTEIVHVNTLLNEPGRFAAAQILCIPGGFSYGDDVSAGRIFACQVHHHLADELHEFKSADKLILGICNGFQMLIKTGLLADDNPAEGLIATLTANDSGRYDDRWVRLTTSGDRCVFFRGIESMELPVAHAEGRFVARSPRVLAELETRGQLALRYAHLNANGSHGASAADELVPYPDNPNGSQANVAGVCDESGRVCGMMPHPERFVDFTQHPRWTRRETREAGDGLRIFENAVAYFG